MARKIRNGYKLRFMKVKIPKSKLNVNSLSSYFNSKIENIKNENDKKFIEYCLKIIKTKNLKKSNE